MYYIKYVLLIIVPYIVYAIFMHWYKNRYDVEISKMESFMIFTMLDILVFVVVDKLWK